MDKRLEGRVIALPESRQLLLLSEMMRKRGAKVLPVPMVAIYDAPDAGPILGWLEGFISHPPDIFILLTGEGLRRLIKLAEKHNKTEAFIESLKLVRKLCRGPKPNKALREIGLDRDMDALSPTTDGVIASLETINISSKNIAVQLYGEDPNEKLIAYLQGCKANVTTVAPYIYADKLAEGKVIALIKTMAEGGIDVIAFTSQPQVKRLLQVAKNAQIETLLHDGLKLTAVAAVGPVVRDMLKDNGIATNIMPERTYFMKPMVNAIARYLNG